MQERGDVIAQFHDNVIHLVNSNKTPTSTHSLKSSTQRPAPPALGLTRGVDFSANDQNALTKGKLFPRAGKTFELPFRPGPNTEHGRLHSKQNRKHLMTDVTMTLQGPSLERRDYEENIELLCAAKVGVQ